MSVVKYLTAIVKKCFFINNLTATITKNVFNYLTDTVTHCADGKHCVCVVGLNMLPLLVFQIV